MASPAYDPDTRFPDGQHGGNQSSDPRIAQIQGVSDIYLQSVEVRIALRGGRHFRRGPTRRPTSALSDCWTQRTTKVPRTKGDSLHGHHYQLQIVFFFGLLHTSLRPPHRHRMKDTDRLVAVAWMRQGSGHDTPVSPGRTPLPIITATTI